MARAKLIHGLAGPVPGIVLSLVLLGAVFMLTSAAQHSGVFGELYSVLLVVNVLGIGALLVLIIVNLSALVRRLRNRELGSRLTLRLVAIFVLLSVIPLSVVYYFSVQFINKGIDSWFDVRIEQALDDALMLGRTSLEAIKQDTVDNVEQAAALLSEERRSELELIQLLDDVRARYGYAEMSLYTQTGRVIAFSSQEPNALIPDTLDETTLSQLRIRQDRVQATIEPAPDGGLQLQVVAPVLPVDVSQPRSVLHVLKPLPLRYARLGQSVQSAFAEYEKLVYLRGPLKFSFLLTLTLVTLMTGLIAVWAAIYSSRRVVAPLRDLAEGTRAVAAGNYGKQLPVTTKDELGVLVGSFNDMTKRIRQAQLEVRRSQRQTEQQRTYLETVLAHLSSGVLSFDRRRRLRTGNVAATQILGVELDAEQGMSLDQLAAAHPRLAPLYERIREAAVQQVPEWQAEVAVMGRRARQVLMCRGTRLPGSDGNRAGYVVVFDDVTDLIQAQRDAAWGEVARRLAHEIKNPLTPIQLSAERIRRKYLERLAPAERDTLDRATRTIAQQVESMKHMVNAFSSYAQPTRMQPRPVSLERLVRDVAELHHREEGPLHIDLQLDPDLPDITADPDRLRQVLNNLLINARDALAGVDEPRITVRTARVRDRDRELVELEVRDNGGGFPEDILDRLFEPYVTTKDKGTGLGLAIVKRIVEEHGGMLWAQNLAEGGASVVLHLPLAVSRDGRSTDPGGKPVRHSRSGERIA